MVLVVIVNITSASTAILFNHNWKNSSCLSHLPHGIGRLYKKLKNIKFDGVIFMFPRRYVNVKLDCISKIDTFLNLILKKYSVYKNVNNF